MQTCDSNLKVQGERWLDALAQFCVRAGAPHCYQNWTPETLRDYLAFHAAQGTLAWTADSQPSTLNPQLTGIGIAWQTTYAQILAGEAEGGYRFDWQPTNPKGDSVFLADFVCTRRGGLAHLIAHFGKLHGENWSRRLWFTYRPNSQPSTLNSQPKRLVRLTTRHLHLLAITSKKGNQCPL